MVELEIQNLLANNLAFVFKVEWMALLSSATFDEIGRVLVALSHFVACGEEREDIINDFDRHLKDIYEYFRQQIEQEG